MSPKHVEVNEPSKEAKRNVERLMAKFLLKPRKPRAGKEKAQ